MKKQNETFKQEGTKIDPFNMTTEEMMNAVSGEKEGDETPAESPTENKDEKETPPSEETKETKEVEETKEETTETTETIEETKEEKEKKEEVEETKEETTETKETKEETPKKSEEKQIPFHEHPRFKELIDDKNTANQKVEDLRKDIEDIKKGNDKPGEIPQKFVEMYGDDKDAWDFINELIDDRTNTKINAFIKQQTEAQTKQVEEQKEANKWTDSEFTRLVAEGKKFDKEELKGVMIKFQPTKTENGEQVLDFDRGFEILELTKTTPKKPDKKVIKKVINSDTQTAPAEDTDKVYTPLDFKPWLKKKEVE